MSGHDLYSVTKVKQGLDLKRNGFCFKSVDLINDFLTSKCSCGIWRTNIFDNKVTAVTTITTTK